MVSFQFLSLSTYINLSLLISAGGAAPLDYVNSAFYLERRDKDNGPVKCFFEWNKAVQLKDNGSVFRNKCIKRTDKMAIPVKIGDPDVSTIFEGTFKECKDFDKGVGNCQCDHLLEPQEVLGAFSNVITVTDAKAPKTPLSSTQITALCKVLGGTKSGEQIRGILNAPDNLAGLYGNNQAGGNFVTAPNQEKNILLSANAADVEKQYSKLKWAYEIAALHMEEYKPNRGRAAKGVDDLLLEWDGLVAASKDDDATAGWKLVVDSIGIGIGNTPMKTLVDKNTNNVISLVEDARPGGIAPTITRKPVPKTPRSASGNPVPPKPPKRKATSSSSNTPSKKPKLATPPVSGTNPAVPGPAQPVVPKRKGSTSSSSSTGSTSTSNKKQKVATPSTGTKQTTAGSSTAKKVPAVPPKVPATKKLPVGKPPPKTPVKPAVKAKL